MAANKRKILENARKYAQKGAKEKALAEYQKLVKLDPRDAKLRLEIGDTYRRWGQVDQAIDTYGRVAEQYMKEGFDARAVAVWKQILNLDPDRHASYEPLAELYERMGLTAEAINALQMAADGHHRAGRKREALDVLRKMSSIDPSNTTSRIKVAELLRQEGMAEEAVSEYEQVAEELERQGDLEAAGNVYRRVIEIDSGRTEISEKFARNLLGQGKAAEAESLAKRVLDSNPDEPGHYELLADVYRAQGREDLLGRVYKALAELYRRRGDEEKARDLLQRFVPPDQIAIATADPERELGGGDSQPEFGALGGDLVSEDALSQMGGQPMIQGAGNELELGPELELGRDEPDAGDDDALDLDQPLAPPPPTPAAPSRTPAAAPAGDPDQLIAEASVYLRYGKREKAIAHLEALLAATPGHRVALEKLGEAFAEGGDTARAVATWREAVERARAAGDTAAVQMLSGRIEALDPTAAPGGAARSTEPEPDEPFELDLSSPGDDGSIEDEGLSAEDLSFEVEPPAAAPPQPVPHDEGPDLDLDADDSSSAELDLDLDVDFEEPAPPTPAVATPARPARARSDSDASLSSTTAQQVMEDLEEADFYMQQGLHAEAEEIYQRVLAVAPNHPRALLRLGEVAAARGEDPGTTGTDLRAPTPSIAAAAPDADDEEEIPVDVEMDIDLEAESDAAPPLFGDSEEEPSIDLGADLDVATEDPVAGTGDAPAEASPEDAMPDDDTGELSIPTESLEPAPAPVFAPGEGFDLAAELSDVFDGDANETSGAGRSGDDGFAAVFEAFKRGVSETLSEADHEAHYDLGIAYKEMGLLDDAIQEFRAAMVHPPRVVECLHLIALCALDADRPEMATEHLEQLLEMPNVTPAQQLASRYELGRAYHALSRNDEAREAFEQVLAVDARYLDTAERLAKLDAPEPPPSAGAGDAQEFESFDDILSDVEEDEDDADEVDADEVDEATATGEDFGDLMAEVAEEDDATPRDDDTPVQAPRAAAPASAGRPRRKKKISFL